MACGEHYPATPPGAMLTLFDTPEALSSRSSPAFYGRCCAHIIYKGVLVNCHGSVCKGYVFNHIEYKIIQLKQHVYGNLQCPFIQYKIPNF